MGKDRELVLVHNAMKHVNIAHTVNIMLTPQFYTLKKEAIPVRWAYQAKRIAPSLFMGLLEEGKSYEYIVWKEGDEWVFLAYDIEMIKTFLVKKGLALEYVAKLFFAQQSMSSFTKPLALGEDEALVLLDNTVVVVPRVALAAEETLSKIFNNSFTPAINGITLNQSSRGLLSSKETVVFATVFAVFALVFFIEGWRYGGDSKAGDAELEDLLEAYPSFRSSYTRESIAQKYNTIDRIERKKRETINTLSKMIFKGVTLTSLSLNRNNIVVDFSCTDKKVLKRLKALIEKEQYKVSVINNLTLHVESKL